MATEGVKWLTLCLLTVDTSKQIFSDLADGWWPGVCSKRQVAGGVCYSGCWRVDDVWSVVPVSCQSQVSGSDPPQCCRQPVRRLCHPPGRWVIPAGRHHWQRDVSLWRHWRPRWRHDGRRQRAWSVLCTLYNTCFDAHITVQSVRFNLFNSSQRKS